MSGHGNINNKKIDWRKSTWMAPSHYLNQCWYIVIWFFRNEFQWNINRNSNIFIDKNACEYVCEIVSISSQPQYVNDERNMISQCSTHNCLANWVSIIITYFSDAAVIKRFSLIKFNDSLRNSSLYDNQQWGWYSYHDFTCNLIWILKTRNTVMPKAMR